MRTAKDRGGKGRPPWSNRRLVVSLGVVVGLGLVVAGTMRYVASSRQPVATALSRLAPLPVLGRVPAFHLATDTNGVVAVPAAPVTVLYFMSAQCATCAAGEQALARVAARLPHGTRLISVDVTPVTDPPTTLSTLAHEVGATWPQAYATMGVIKAYNVTALDQLAIVNAHGQILYNGARPSDRQLLALVRRASMG
jgi:hypothetical protein